MRKTLLCIMILICVLACSCGGVPDILLPVSEISNTPKPSPTPAVSEPESQSSEEPSVEETAETAEFLEDAVRLISDDTELTRLIILGGIYSDEAEKPVRGDTTVRTLSAENEYSDYSRLTDFAASVYTKSGSDYLLYYPPYGVDTVISISGETWYSAFYVPDYDDSADISTMKLVSFEDGHASVSLNMKNGMTVKPSFTLTSEGWRLDECVFKTVSDISAKNRHDTAYETTLMNKGSASALRGNCLLINVFLNDSASSWEASGVDKVLERTDEACRFIEAEASAYGITPDIVSTDADNSLYLATSERIPTSMEDFVWIDLLFAETVYRTLAGYAESHFELQKYDNWGVLIHLDKKGRSYALPCDTANSDWNLYYAERSVMFHTDNESYAYYDSPGVYAHEILHLFGASDLYSPYISTSDAQKLEICFPNDIMAEIGHDIGLSAISPYTAYSVGWRSWVDSQFLFLAD